MMNKIKSFFKSLFCKVDGQDSKIGAVLKKPSSRSVISSLICICVGILIGFIIMLVLAITTEDIPLNDASRGLFIILGGPFASKNDIMFILGDMLFQTTPLYLQVFRLQLHSKQVCLISVHPVSI